MLRTLGSKILSATKILFPALWLRFRVGSGATIFTFTAPAERLLLYEEAKAAVKLERFLEIGSHFGASAVVLAAVLRRYGSKPERQVFCIDTWMNDAMSAGPSETRAEFDKNTAQWVQYINAIVADSKTAALPFEGNCDLIFIDGDHSYEGARADVHRFAPLVRPGGRLLVHDHERISIARVVGELLGSGEWTITRCVGQLLSLKRESLS